MTSYQLASAVFNHVLGHRKAVVNHGLSLVQIEDELDNERAQLLEEFARNKFLTTDGLLQTLPIVNLLPKSKANPAGKPAAAGKPATAGRQFSHASSLQMVATATIPQLLLLSGVRSVAYAGIRGGMYPYKVVTDDSYRYAGTLPWSGKRPLVHINSNTLTLYANNEELPGHLQMEAVFASPLRVMEYSYQNPKETVYPLPDQLKSLLIERMVKRYLGQYFRLPNQANTQSDSLINS